jgi:hypothetical protein
MPATACSRKLAPGLRLSRPDSPGFSEGSTNYFLGDNPKNYNTGCWSPSHGPTTASALFPGRMPARCHGVPAGDFLFISANVALAGSGNLSGRDQDNLLPHQPGRLPRPRQGPLGDPPRQPPGRHRCHHGRPGPALWHPPGRRYAWYCHGCYRYREPGAPR